MTMRKLTSRRNVTISKEVEVHVLNKRLISIMNIEVKFGGSGLLERRRGVDLSINASTRPLLRLSLSSLCSASE